MSVKIKCIANKWVLIQREAYGINLSKDNTSTNFILTTRKSYHRSPETLTDNGNALALFANDRVEKISRYESIDWYVLADTDDYIYIEIDHETTSRPIDNAIVGDDRGSVTLNKDQGVRYKGNSTVWKDMIADIFSKRLNGTTGKVDHDYDEMAIKFQSGGDITLKTDRVGGNQEINHEFKVGMKYINLDI